MEQIHEWLEQGNSILIVPGWKNSGPDHWQSLWEKEIPGVQRVNQEDWDHPVAASWVRNLRSAIIRSPGRIIIVAHSLGCITLAHWAATHQKLAQRIAGALLVAPADPMRTGLRDQIKGFLPMPISPLPFSSTVIASDNDPVCQLERASLIALTWKSRLIVQEGAGHINVEAGFGPWPVGLRYLRHMIRDVRAREFH